MNGSKLRWGILSTAQIGRKNWKAIRNTLEIWIYSTIPMLFFALLIAFLLNSAFLRYRTLYRIAITNPEHRCRGVRSTELDGVSVDPRAIPLVDDGQTHEVSVVVDTPTENGGCF